VTARLQFDFLHFIEVAAVRPFDHLCPTDPDRAEAGSARRRKTAFNAEIRAGPTGIPIQPE
jgi:hypothetical protein